jgi:hypothetical protein
LLETYGAARTRCKRRIGLRLEPEEFTLMAINGRGETRAAQHFFWEETHDHAARFAIN